VPFPVNLRKGHPLRTQTRWPLPRYPPRLRSSASAACPLVGPVARRCALARRQRLQARVQPAMRINLPWQSSQDALPSSGPLAQGGATSGRSGIRSPQGSSICSIHMHNPLHANAPCHRKRQGSWRSIQMKQPDDPSCMIRTVASAAGLGTDHARVPFSGPCVRPRIHFDNTVGCSTDKPGEGSER
jgi:hypothetical protein